MRYTNVDSHMYCFADCKDQNTYVYTPSAFKYLCTVQNITWNTGASRARLHILSVASHPFPPLFFAFPILTVALSSAGFVGALGALATDDIDRVPGPARTAAARAAVDPDGVGTAVDVARNAVQFIVRDWDARRSRAAVVCLCDVNAVLGNSGESNVGVVDALDGTGVARYGLHGIWQKEEVSSRYINRERTHGI